MERSFDEKNTCITLLGESLAEDVLDKEAAPHVQINVDPIDLETEPTIKMVQTIKDVQPQLGASFDPMELPNGVLGEIIQHLQIRDIVSLSIARRKVVFHNDVGSEYRGMHKAKVSELFDRLESVFFKKIPCRQKVESIISNLSLQNSEETFSNLGKYFLPLFINASPAEFASLEQTVGQDKSPLMVSLLQDTFQISKRVHRILALKITDSVGPAGTWFEDTRLHILGTSTDSDAFKASLDLSKSNMFTLITIELAMKNRFEEATLIANLIPIPMFKVPLFIKLFALEGRIIEAKDLLIHSSRHNTYSMNPPMSDDEFKQMVASEINQESLEDPSRLRAELATLLEQPSVF